MTLNIIFPLLEIPALVVFNNALYNSPDKNPGKLVVLSSVLAPALVVLLEIITGVYLIRSILKIKRFYKENNIRQKLKTTTLILHSSAFGLYLVSEVLLITSYAVYAIFPTTLEQYSIFLTVWTIMSFVAQMLLCMILFELGAKKKKMRPDKRLS